MKWGSCIQYLHAPEDVMPVRNVLILDCVKTVLGAASEYWIFTGDVTTAQLESHLHFQKLIMVVQNITVKSPTRF